jgi:predicted ATP-dependent protease
MTAPSFIEDPAYRRKESSVATTEEIRRRIEEADTARSAKRAAAAQQVGELAQRRAALAEQLADVERELGDVLAAARDVIDINELARFTDVPAADLMRWCDGRRTTRTKRKKPAGTRDARSETSRGASSAVGRVSGSPATASPRVGVDASEQVAAAV